MSGYPHNYGGYGAPPPSTGPTYGGPAPSTGYGAPTPYGAPPPSSDHAYNGPVPSTGYGAPPSSSGQTYGGPAPSTTQQFGSSAPYGASPQSSAQTYGGPPPSATQHYSSSAHYGASPQSSAQTYSEPPPYATQSYSSSAPYSAPDQSPYASATNPYSAYSSDPSKPPKDKISASYDGAPPSANQSYGSQAPYAASAPPGQYSYAQYSGYSSDPMKPPKDNKPQASYGGPPPSTTQFHGSPSPYSSSPPPGHSPYAPVGTPYSGYSSDPIKPPKDNKPSAPYGGSNPSAPYGAPPPSAPYGAPPPSAPYGGAAGASPFAPLLPSRFPPGIDPNIIACFQIADQDGSGFIDDKEMQRALSTYNERFSLHTVHLLMYHFTNTNAGKIGPKEFTDLFHSLQKWRAIFERFDRDQSGKIDVNELREALLSQGFAVPPAVLDLLVSKFDKSSGKNKAIDYENFLECCLTVKGLTEKFKEKDVGYTGSVTFTYESFMLTVLPFLIA